MRKTTIGVAFLAVAATLSFGCHQARHPSHQPDELGNAAPIKQVATEAHARDIATSAYMRWSANAITEQAAGA